MTTLFDIEEELADFNLDKMHVKARENLLKIANLVGPLDLTGWRDFIENGSLNVTAIIKEIGISRSSYYQNKHIVTYIQKKAQWLVDQEVLLDLPYQARNDMKERPVRYSPLEKIVKEKDNSIRQLQLKVAELESRLEGLKQECISLRTHSRQDQYRTELLDLFQRVPR